MSRYSNTSSSTYAQGVDRLKETFAKWGVGFEHFDIACGTTPQRRDGWNLTRDERSVTVQYRPPGRQSVVTMTLDTQTNCAKNLSAIAITIEGIRMQERRGLAQIAAAHYLAIDAPLTQRDPFEVLGLRPDAPPRLINVAYQELAKAAHPDTGGSTEKMKELNEARELAMERAQS